MASTIRTDGVSRASSFCSVQSEAGVRRPGKADSVGLSPLQQARIELEAARTRLERLQKPPAAWRRHIKTGAIYLQGLSLTMMAVGLMVPPLLPFAGLVGASYWTVVGGLFLLATGVRMIMRQADKERVDALEAARVELKAAKQRLQSLNAAAPSPAATGAALQSPGVS